MITPVMVRTEDHRPWGLILGLTLAVLSGLLSLPLQVATFRNLDAASQADVRRAAELTEQLSRQSADDAAAAREFREDSRRLQLSICDQIEAIASQRDLNVEPCPRVPTNPEPVENP